MDTERWRVLTSNECLSLIDNHHFGRFAFVEDGVPCVLPVNYTMFDGAVIFRTNPGTMLEVARRGDTVAFEVDGIDPGDRSGWSVLARGAAQHLNDPTELDRLKDLPLVAWAPGLRPHLIRIHVAQLTGRRISAADLPSHWWG